MVRTVWFLTHPEVTVEPEVPVPRWGLSARGRARAERLARAPWWSAVTSVWSSAETKALEASELVAGGIPRFVREDLGENDRSATGFVPPREFEALADAFFGHPDDRVRGWATARDEQARIVAAVEDLLGLPEAGDGDIAIVAHGGVGTLLRCHLLQHPIDRALDQPGQGHGFAFDRDTRAVHCGWLAYEDLARPAADILG